MNRLSDSALAALSHAYGWATAARIRLYQKEILRARGVDAPVISVGNITVGGTGKTPLVAWLARALADAGKRPCVLTRGYKRQDEDARVVVSDGKQLLADWRTGGDEPRVLAEELLGIASVVSDKRRYEAARWAQVNLGSDAFVLDDGFQHLALRRDLDIVTIDALDPFGGNKLLPRGKLREPLANLARADCAIITRADLVQNLDETVAALRRISNKFQIFTARTRTARITELKQTHDEPENAARSDHSATNKTVALPFSKDLIDAEAALSQPLLAFCALGNAEAFFSYARRERFNLHDTRRFTDHYNYTQADVDALERDARQGGASALLTTKKDAVKLSTLRFDLPCYVLEIKLEIDNDAALLALINDALKKRRG